MGKYCPSKPFRVKQCRTMETDYKAFIERSKKKQKNHAIICIYPASSCTFDKKGKDYADCRKTQWKQAEAGQTEFSYKEK